MSTSLPAALFFCGLCEKPFTREQQYKRHTTYCARSHGSRIRQRSCRNCNSSKVKCDFGTPKCRSCVKKGVRCCYDSKSSRNGVIPRSTPPNTETTTSDSVLLSSSEMESSTSTSPNALISQQYSQNINPDALLLETPPAMLLDADFEFIPPNDNNFFNLDFLQDDFLYCESSSGKELQILTPRPIFSHTSPMSSFLSLPSSVTHFEHNTAQTPAHQIFLTMIIDMIQAYPRMMSTPTTLPPFIHTHFLSSSPILQTCQALSHLFTTRTPSTRSFIWGSIWASLRTFGKRAGASDSEIAMDRHEAVSSCLACLIYFIMRAIDGGGDMEGSDWEMLGIYDAIKTCLMETTHHNPWHYNPNEDGEIPWIDWIYMESNLRIGCLWYILKMVFHLKTGGPCFVSDHYKEIPLPCSKGEWEARSEEEWRRERAAARSKVAAIGGLDGGRALWKFGDLMDASGRDRRSGLEEGLGVWIAGMDGLGAVLNLVVHLV